MIAYLVRRLLLFIPMLIGMVIVTFGLLLLIPGDPAAVLLGQEATPTEIATLRIRCGLDRPGTSGCGDYFASCCMATWASRSSRASRSRPSSSGRLGATVELAVVALVLATLIGMTLGVLAAMRQGSLIDTIAMLFAQLGVSMPVYWLGLLLMLAFAVELGWLPSIGRGTPLRRRSVRLFVGHPRCSPIPSPISCCRRRRTGGQLGGGHLAARACLDARGAARGFRTDGLCQGTAPARGCMIRHALRNALLPVLSVIGLRFGCTARRRGADRDPSSPGPASASSPSSRSRSATCR